MLRGGVVTVAGNLVLLTAAEAHVAVLGLLLIGLGAANTVPVLFRQAGLQARMPPGQAVAAITTFG